MMEEDILLSKKIHPSYPYTMAEVKWVIQNEMAITIEDVLARRIRLLFLDAKAAMEAAPLVATMLGPLTGNDAEWQQDQVEEFNKLAKNYLLNQSK